MYAQAFELFSIASTYAFALAAAFVLFYALFSTVRDVTRAAPPQRLGSVCGRLDPRSDEITSAELPCDALLGASRRCDVRLRGAGILAEHAQITVEDGAAMLRPLPGAPVLLNDQLVEESIPLRDGDSLKLGDMELVLFLKPPTAPPALRRRARVLDTMALCTIVFVLLLGFLLGALRTPEGDAHALLLGAIASVGMLLIYVLFERLFPGIDRTSLIVIEFLMAIGLVMLYRVAPVSCEKQLLWIGAGAIAMMLSTLLVRRATWLHRPLIAYGVVSVILLCASLVFGDPAGGARSWIQLPGFWLQPSEFVKILLAFMLAASLHKKGDVRRLWQLFAFLVCALLVLVLQRDLGAAFLYFSVASMALWMATSNWLLSGGLLLGGGALGAASYLLFAHVRTRVLIWRNPWSSVNAGGYQIVQALMAIASGGLMGMGLYRGMPRVIPAYSTDFIFAVVCEEMGVVVGFVIIALYGALLARGLSIARRAPDRFNAILAFSATAMISIQALLIIGGVIKLIPLTGVTLPFVSYGGSSMVANMAMLGVWQGVAVKRVRFEGAGEPL